MFSNRFNTKNDPILEAVEGAMKDGALRRQAEAIVNEEFGVYSRNAVVRENLAAYDARLEEAYKCMKEDEKSEKKEKKDDGKAEYSKMREKMVGKGKDAETTRKIVGEELAKKDYDKDGKIESGKDEVWGSRLRAAKMAGKLKEEEQIDEISKELAGRYIKKASKDLRKKSFEAGKESEADDYWGREGKERYDRKPLRKAGKRLKGIQRATDRMEESEQMDEAAYSAKAGRAGKDLGKPGKNFSKIADKVGGEKGKRVAGAILKRIRAKHMKEDAPIDESAFGSAFAAARKGGQSTFSFGGKSYNTKMASSSPASKSSVNGPSTLSQRAQSATTTMSGGQGASNALKPGPKNYPDVGNVGGKASAVPNSPMKPVDRETTAKGPNTGGEVGVKSAGPMGTSVTSLDRPAPSAAPTPAPKPVPTINAPTTPVKTMTDAGKAAQASNMGMPKNDASAGVKKLMSMNESVQVGANKYRIV